MAKGKYEYLQGGRREPIAKLFKLKMSALFYFSKKNHWPPEKGSAKRPPLKLQAPGPSGFVSTPLDLCQWLGNSN